MPTTPTNRTLVLALALPGVVIGAVTFTVLTLPLGLGNGSHSPEGVSGWGFLIGILGYLSSGVLLFAGSTVALAQTALSQQWGWFGVLLGEGIVLLVLAGILGFYAPWVFLIVPLTLVLYGVVGLRMATRNVM
jgi:hypothetical protein